MKKLMVIILALVILTQTGCWDQREINEIGFVIAIAIDPVKENSDKKNHIEKFATTFQIALPEGTEEANGSGQGSSFFHVTSTEMTNFKNVRDIANRESHSLFLEHLTVIIISEELANEGMVEHLLDFYFRDHEMRRNIKILISKGPAKSFITQQPNLQEMSGESIDMIFENNEDRSFEMIRSKEIGKVGSLLLGRHSYILPGIMNGENDLKVAGGAIFKGEINKMIGWLNDNDLIGFNLIVGETKTGILEIPTEEDELFVFDLKDFSSNIDYERKNGENHFTVDIKAEGSFGESWIHDKEELDEDMVNKLESSIEKEIKHQVNHVIDKMKSEFFTDVFNLWREIEIHENRYWKEIQDNWDGEDGEFTNATITVNSEVEIRDYMLIEGLE